MEFISQWEESGTYKQNVYDSSGIDMIYEETKHGEDYRDTGCSYQFVLLVGQRVPL
jgi:hypothetical protein